MDSNFWLNVILALLVMTTALLGVRGNTWDGKKRTFIRRITISGWVTIGLAASTLLLGGTKELLDAKERHSSAEEKRLKRLLAIDSILGELPYLHRGLVEAMKNPSLRTSDYANATLDLMRTELEKKIDRHRDQLPPDTLRLGEATLSQQKIAILELSSKPASMAQIVQTLMNAVRQTDEFAKAILDDARSSGIDLKKSYERIIGFELE